MEFNFWTTLSGVSPKDHFCKVCLQLATWFRRCRFKKLLTTGHHNSSLWARCVKTCELTTKKLMMMVTGILLPGSTHQWNISIYEVFSWYLKYYFKTYSEWKRVKGNNRKIKKERVVIPVHSTPIHVWSFKLIHQMLLRSYVPDRNMGWTETITKYPPLIKI